MHLILTQWAPAQGTYTEQLVVSRPNVKLYGETPVHFSYRGNSTSRRILYLCNIFTRLSKAVTIENDLSAYDAGGDDESGTVRILSGATDVALYNLNILNKNLNVSEFRSSTALSWSFFHSQGPGVALSVYATR